MPIELTPESLRALENFRQFGPKVQRNIRAALKRALLRLEEKVRAGTDVKWRRGRAGLLGRLTSYVEEQGAGGLDGVIGFRRNRGFPYELAQEFGAQAKPGGAMAIPVSAKARALCEQGVKPRDFPVKLVRPPNMHVLAEVYKRGGGLKTIHFVLVKSIAPRLNFQRSVVENGAIVSEELEAAVGAAL